MARPCLAGRSAAIREGEGAEDEPVAMDCKEFQLFVQAYVDGEFEATDAAAMDAHVEVCEGCRAEAEEHARFVQFVKANYEPEPVPEGLRRRIVEVLEAQDAMELAAGRAVATEPSAVPDALASARAGRWRRLEWVIGPALATAAAVLLVLLAVRPFEAPVVSPSAMSTAAMAGSGGGSEVDARTPIVEEAVTWHRRNLPIEVAGPSNAQVGRWFDGKVNFPVRLPEFEERAPGQVQLLGARLSNVRERQAAYVVYEVDGRKMSVMAFDGKDIAMPKPDQGEPIYFENASGYNVAVVEDNGITYSITSELPRKDMAELVQAAFKPR